MKHLKVYATFAEIEQIKTEQRFSGIYLSSGVPMGNPMQLIYSRGSLKGVDSLVKKFALEFDCNFAEFTPAHLSKTLYSVNQNYDHYNQPFSGRDIYKRSSQMIKVCHAFIIFKYEEDIVIDYMLKEINKSNKKVKLFETYETMGSRRN